MTPPTPIPDWNIVERTPVEAANPYPLPPLCSIPWDIDDIDCWRKLDAYDVVAIGNYDIAVANTEALRTTEMAYDVLVEAGKLQNQLSDIRQDLLDQERTAHTMDTWFYRGLITLGIVAVGL